MLRSQRLRRFGRGTCLVRLVLEVPGRRIIRRSLELAGAGADAVSQRVGDAAVPIQELADRALQFLLKRRGDEALDERRLERVADGVQHVVERSGFGQRAIEDAGERRSDFIAECVQPGQRGVNCFGSLGVGQRQILRGGDDLRVGRSIGQRLRLVRQFAKLHQRRGPDGVDALFLLNQAGTALCAAQDVEFFGARGVGSGDADTALDLGELCGGVVQAPLFDHIFNEACAVFLPAILAGKVASALQRRGFTGQFEVHQQRLSVAQLCCPEVIALRLQQVRVEGFDLDGERFVCSRTIVDRQLRCVRRVAFNVRGLRDNFLQLGFKLRALGGVLEPAFFQLDFNGRLLIGEFVEFLLNTCCDDLRLLVVIASQRYIASRVDGVQFVLVELEHVFLEREVVFEELERLVKLRLSLGVGVGSADDGRLVG